MEWPPCKWKEVPWGSNRFRIYKEDYMNEKTDQWIKEVKLLSEIVKIEPQCALSCFISGYKYKLNYYMRTVPNISNLLQHIDIITK